MGGCYIAPMTATSGRRIRGLDAEQRKQQRRDDLLDAALELFSANGYQSTSVEQICQLAYVGTKSFYELFESREDCYVALLRRLTERIMGTMVERFEELPADDEATATRTLIARFADALVDDPRVAKVTFGEGSAVSPAVERQRRANRRRAAEFIEAIWTRYGVAKPRGGKRRWLHHVAMGTIGGMFELVADWLLDADPTRESDRDELVAALTGFYDTVRAGLSA